MQRPTTGNEQTPTRPAFKTRSFDKCVGKVGFFTDGTTLAGSPGLPGETGLAYAARVARSAHGRDPDPIGVDRLPHGPIAA